MTPIALTSSVRSHRASLPEAHRPRGLSLSAIETIGVSDRAQHMIVRTIMEHIRDVLLTGTS
jgi:hypothetical protein